MNEAGDTNFFDESNASRGVLATKVRIEADRRTLRLRRLSTLAERERIETQMRSRKPPPAIDFSGKSVKPSFYDGFATHSGAWLMSAATLLRAGRAVLFHAERDQEELLAAGKEWLAASAIDPSIKFSATHITPRASLSMPAIYLAALAVENALKGAIAASHVVAEKSGILASALTGHNLEALANKAGVAAINEDEQDALKFGQRVIEALGRYHIPKNHQLWSEKTSFETGRVFGAYTELCLRAVEAIAEIEHARWPNLQDRTVDQYVAQQREHWIARVGSIFPEDERQR